MYNEFKQIDRIEVVNGNIIQVREVTVITKDDVEIARTYHRWSFTNFEDMKDMPQEVKDIAKVVFKL
jgi:hypothetical protein